MCYHSYFEKRSSQALFETKTIRYLLLYYLIYVASWWENWNSLGLLNEYEVDEPSLQVVNEESTEYVINGFEFDADTVVYVVFICVSYLLLKTFLREWRSRTNK